MLVDGSFFSSVNCRVVLENENKNIYILMIFADVWRRAINKVIILINIWIPFNLREFFFTDL